MPNHVRNLITSPNMKKLKELFLNEKDEADFNNIIPMPEDLQITAGGVDYDEAAFASDAFQTTDDVLKKVIKCCFEECYDKKLTRLEFINKVRQDNQAILSICQLKGFNKTDRKSIDAFISGYYNVRKYGSNNWYNWSIKHWGTKWNAYENNIDDNEIEFSTAWSMPKPIYKKLSKQVTLTVAFSDEDWGSDNNGIYRFENGNIIDLAKGINPAAIGYVMQNVDSYIDEYDEEDRGTLPSREEIDKVRNLLNELGFNF